MIARFLATAGRHHRVILVAGLVLSVGYLLVHLWVPALGRRAFPAMTAALAASLMLVLLAVVRDRPKAFVVQPRVPAFSAPPQPVFLFMALTFLILATGYGGLIIRDWGAEPLSDQLEELVGVAVFLLAIPLAWRDTRVQLRPEGLWQRGITGWLVVPWEAAPTVPALLPPPRARTVRLKYGRPELVRRHGVHVYRHRLHTDDIDPRFLCAAIRYYLAHPEHRTAIGTRAEYERVLPHLLGSLDWLPPHTAPAEPDS